MNWLNRITRTSGEWGTGRLRFRGRLVFFGSVLAGSLVLAWAFSPSLIGQQQTIRATEHQRDGADLIRKRSEWFLHQREFPLGFIPAGAREKALEQRDQMIREQGSFLQHLAGLVHDISFNASSWTPIGPQPTTGSVNGFGNVSGRVLALAVDPRDLSGNTVYLGGAIGGVWKTADGGTTWIPKTDPMPSLAISALALDTKTDPNNTIIYAGTGEGDFGFDSFWGSGLLKSLDSGTTWTSIGATAFGATAPINSITQGPFIFALAAQPNITNPALLAALRGSGATLLSGIWRSTNGGTTWANVFPANLTQTGNIGTDVVFDPFDATGKTAYAAIGLPFASQPNPLNGIYKSTDGGATWTSLNSKITTSISTIAQGNFGRISLSVGKPSSGSVGVLYASIADHSQDSTRILAMIKSTDGGQTWTNLTTTPNFCAGQCWFDMVVKASPTNSSLVMIGGGAVGGTGSSTVFRSTDGGNTWSDVSFTGTAGQTVHVDQHAGAFTLDGTKYYIGNDGGAWSSTTVTNPANTPAQVTWNNLNNTLQLTQFYPHLTVHPSTDQIAFGGAQDNGTQQFSGSLAWSDMNVCGDGGWTAVDPFVPAIMYAGCENPGGGATGFNPINKTTNSGATFVETKAGVNFNDNSSFIPPLVLDPENPDIVYFGTSKVYQTTNGAGLWTAISPDLSGIWINSIAVAPNNSNTIYVGTEDSRLWLTTNATSTSPAFSEVNKTPLPPRAITQVVVDPANSQAAYVTFSGFASCLSGCDQGGHVFVTTNGGATFADITGNLPDVPVNDVVIDPDDTLRRTLYIGTDVGVFGTADGGITWAPLVTGLPNVEVTTLALREASRTLVAGTHGRGAWALQLPGNPFNSSLSLGRISPVGTAASSSAPNLTLSVEGEGFTNSSVVKFNGTALATTFQDSSDLQATIPGSMLATAGSASITVSNGSQTSNALPFLVTGTADFAFGAPSPASQTITAGQTAVFTVPLHSVNPSNTSILISCGGLPTGAVCTPTPNPAVPGGGTLNLSMSIATLAKAGLPGTPGFRGRPWTHFELWFLVVLAVFIAFALRAKAGARRRLAFGLAICLLAMVVGLQVACGGGTGGGGGGGGGGQTGTFNIVFTGTAGSGAGSFSHTAQVTLTVQ